MVFANPSGVRFPIELCEWFSLSTIQVVCLYAFPADPHAFVSVSPRGTPKPSFEQLRISMAKPLCSRRRDSNPMRLGIALGFLVLPALALGAESAFLLQLEGEGIAYELFLNGESVVK